MERKKDQLLDINMAAQAKNEQAGVKNFGVNGAA
jgi:hypothetical protein